MTLRGLHGAVEGGSGNEVADEGNSMARRTDRE